MKCGKTIKNENTLICYDCTKYNHYFDRGFSIFEYQEIKGSLYRFKYAGRAEYARFYAKTAYENLGDTLRNLHADALVPIPIHSRRYRKRGYNQAEEFALQISNYLELPVYSQFIKRKAATAPLKKLSRIERQNNLKRAFIITRNDVKLKTIIIIDDIYTTGATIDAVSRVCRAAGVQNIYFLTVAIGNGI